MQAVAMYSISIDTIIPHGRKEACMRSKVSKVSKVLLLAQRAYYNIIIYTQREKRKLQDNDNYLGKWILNIYTHAYNIPAECPKVM